VKPDQGDVTLGKHSLTKSSLRRAIQVGMGYCPEDRKQDGIVAELSVRENMILALQASKGLVVRRFQWPISNVWLRI